jgi:DNA-binding transcriptional LysR family regulator
MRDPVDSVVSLRAFVEAAEARSFKAAGQVLGVSSSAIGKAIARLEGQLATTLFHRTTRTISLTEAGGLFLIRARRILEELQAGEAELAEASGMPRGRLRVSLPVTGELLTHALATFVASYPLVELDLDYSDRIVDVIEEGFDVVIRTGATGIPVCFTESWGNSAGSWSPPPPMWLAMTSLRRPPIWRGTSACASVFRPGG